MKALIEMTQMADVKEVLFQSYTEDQVLKKVVSTRFIVSTIAITDKQQLKKISLDLTLEPIVKMAD